MGIDSIIIEKLTIPSSLTSLVLVESLIDRVCNTIHVNEDVYGNVLEVSHGIFFYIFYLS